LGLRLTETPEVSNTITLGNSLSFPMVYTMDPNSLRFMSYDYRKLDRTAESEIWADYIPLGISQEFDEIPP
jgi:hypothetical protein